MRIILFSVLLLFCFALEARDQDYVSSKIQINAGSSVGDSDSLELLYPSAGNLLSWSSVGRIRLFTEDAGFSPSQYYKLRLRLRIYMQDSLGTERSETSFLQVEHNPRLDTLNGITLGESFLRFENVTSLRYEILSVNIEGNVGGNLNSNLQIEMQESAYHLPPAQAQGGSISLNGNFFNINVGTLPSTVDGYELEWSYVEAYNISAAVFNGTASPQSTDILPRNSVRFDFDDNGKRNSTRVSLGLDSTYSIRNVYGIGYLIYRYRYFNYTDPQERLKRYSAWSCENTTCSGVVSDLFSGFVATIDNNNQHEDGTLNWRYQAQYSEGGRRRETVEYFDGLNKPHQQVSVIESQQEAIVSETYYDAYNRPSIKVLPSPAFSDQMQFYSLFNRPENDGSRAYNFEDFQSFDSTKCGSLAEAMLQASGASRYYSPNNTGYIDSTTIHNDYIPSAQGYPFVHTEYELSPDQRVLAQSQPGIDHALGRVGTEDHAQRYWYADAGQAEMDRLFGTDVGLSEYYRKMVSQDANGQLSVSYLNQAGNVVASALTGGIAGGLDSLGGIDYLSMRENNVFTDLLKQGNTRSHNFSLLVTEAQQYAFEYTVSRAQFFDSYCQDSIITCYSCSYDMVLDIQDECGNAIYDTAVSVGSPNDTLCNQDILNIPFNVDLQVGVYQISKRLTLSQAAIDFNLERFFNQNLECTVDFQELLEEELAELNASACFELDCESLCEDSAGLSLWDRYRCLTACSAIDPCADNEELMRYDISPGGQYAGFFLENDTNYVFQGGGKSYPLSIYNRDNTNNFYQNKNIVYYNGQGVAVNLSAMSVEDIINNWRQEWASAMVVLHPEYGCLSQCQNNRSTQEYGQIMDAVDSYQTAYNLGLMHAYQGSSAPSSLGDFVREDPLFSALPSVLRSEFINTLNRYDTIEGSILTIWEMAALLSSCDSKSNITCLDAVKNNINSYYPAQLDVCSSDNVWVFYRSLYRALRQKYSAKLLESSTCYVSLGAGKRRRFMANNPQDYQDTVDVPNLGSSEAQYNEYSESALLASCETNCQNMSAYWMDRLRACYTSSGGTISQSDSLALVQGLIAVCSAGCDLDHVQGSSTLAPGDSTIYGDRSFEDVLLRVLGPQGLNQSCSHLLLSKPLPYEDTRIEPDFTGAVDTCACSAYLEARQALESGQAPGHITDLDAYIEYLYEEEPYNAALIACRCDQAYQESQGGTGTWSPGAVWPQDGQAFIDAAMPTGAYVVPSTQCQSCASCADVAPLWREAQDYWQALPESNYDQGPDSLFRHHRLIETYINQQLGLRLSYWEYLSFFQQCNGISQENPICNVNTTLVTHLSRFFTSLTANSDLYENACLCVSPYSDRPNNNTPRYYSDLLATYVEPNFNRNNCDQEYLFESLSSDGKLEGKISNFRGDDCIVSFLPENLADSIYMDQIQALYNLEAIADGVGTSFRFSITATVGGGLRASKTIQLVGESTCFPLAECTDDASFAQLCEGDYDKAQPRNDCYQNILDIAMNRAQLRYDEIVDSMTAYFLEYYTMTCVDKASEGLAESYRMLDYPFTLYYYDRAGNLVKTIPPEGFRPLDLSDTALVINARDSGYSYQPNHVMETAYEYNSYGEVIYQWMPDHDSLTIDSAKQVYSQFFWYDDLGRIQGSRNTRQEQLSTDRHSYTLYDDQNRVIETGEKDSVLIMVLDGSQTSSFNTQGGINNGQFTTRPSDPPRYNVNHYDVTVTHYDEDWTEEVASYFPEGRENMQNRISSVLHYEYFRNKRPEKDEYDHGTHYSYDSHGNVKTLIQDFNHLRPLAQRLFYIDYKYDLISGNVKEVAYQKGKFDAFYHRYTYDEDNRIQEVYTSLDGDYWENDARYDYYRHGPLARTEIGDRNLQGMDYAYTIQGWLKGLNSSRIGLNDMNHDGQLLLSGDDRWTARDAIAMRLDYYQGDYNPIGLAANLSFNSGIGTSTNLYNGNIKAMSVSLWEEPWNSTLTSPNPPLNHRQNYYAYDQLNRLKAMWTDNNTRGSAVGKYSTEYSYDYNGNILSLKRNDDAGLRMDDLSYTYHQNEARFNNRLENVQENAILANGNNNDYVGLSGTNNLPIYRYDGIGNLRSDSSEGIRRIEWTAQGKIRAIIRENTTKNPAMYFHYDGMGMRTMKITKTRRSNDPASILPPYRNNQEEDWIETIYVRDAQGNVMARYNLDVNEPSLGNYTERLNLEEHYMYGSDRLGSRLSSTENTSYGSFKRATRKRNGTFGRRNYEYKSDNEPLTAVSVDDGRPILFPSVNKRGKRKNAYLGYKRYELKNHLGNVLSTISDRKQSVHAFTAVVANTGGNLLPNPFGDPIPTLTHYEPEVVSLSDYYPFGSLLPGRHHDDQNYNYGFNGMERDDEIKGGGNSLDFGARIYDSRLGRWLSLDPLARKYSSMSPYTSFANNPIVFVDPDGREISYQVIREEGKRPKIVITVSGKIADLSSSVFNDVQGFAEDLNEQKISFEGLGSDSKWDFEVNFNFTVAEKMSEINQKDHLIVVADPEYTKTYYKDGVKTEGAHGLMVRRGGKTMYLNEDDINWVSNGQGERTIKHEIWRHILLGQTDPDPRFTDKDKLSLSGGTGDEITSSEAYQVVQRITNPQILKGLNSGSPVYKDGGNVYPQGMSGVVKNDGKTYRSESNVGKYFDTREVKSQARDNQ